MGGVVVVGEEHDRTTRVAGGEDHVLQGIARFRFGVDDDQVGLQLADAVRQKYIGRQGGDQVKTALEQANTQGAGPFCLGPRVVVAGVFYFQIRRDHHDPQSGRRGGLGAFDGHRGL